jgi:hypothetical protein
MKSAVFSEFVCEDVSCSLHVLSCSLHSLRPNLQS